MSAEEKGGAARKATGAKSASAYFRDPARRPAAAFAAGLACLLLAFHHAGLPKFGKATASIRLSSSVSRDRSHSGMTLGCMGLTNGRGKLGRVWLTTFNAELLVEEEQSSRKLLRLLEALMLCTS